MKTEIFEHTVAGPFQPIEWIGECYASKTKVATLQTALEVAHFYRSVLMFRRHCDAMSKSMRHAQIMMGEIDEPSEEDSNSKYNPLAWAGLFGICFVLESVDTHDSKGNRALSDQTKTSAMGVIIQLMFALARDDEALAKLSRYWRTGFIGSPNSFDESRADEIRSFVSAIASRGEQMEKFFIENIYEIPLHRPYSWSYSNNCGYAGMPIEIPKTPYEGDE